MTHYRTAMRAQVATLALLCLAAPASSRAQTPCDAAPAPLSVVDFLSTRQRLDEVRGRVTPTLQGIRSTSLGGSPACLATGRPWIAPAPASVGVSFQSAYPFDRNNGFRWDGRGVSTSMTGGVLLEWGPLSVRLAPAVALQQNRPFATVDTVFPTDLSPFSDPWLNRVIDLPIRQGDRAYTRFDPGQSSVAISMGPMQVAAATENLWVGPGLWSPLILSNTAGGFPHARIASNRPLHSALGEWGVLVFWGRVEESDYYDSDPENDRRLLSGMTVSLRPAFAPELLIGIAGVVHSSLAAGLKAGDLANFLIFPVETVSENPLEENGLASMFFRWTFPESKAEVWGEWARDDFATSITDLVAEPGHSRAWMLGLQKIFGAPADDGAWIRLAVETASTETPLTSRAGRPPVTFYGHGSLRQGHTNRGQILGSFMGPDANFQRIQIDRFTRQGSAGLYVERIRRRANTYYDLLSSEAGFSDHDVAVRLGAMSSHTWAQWTLEVDASLARRRNRDFVALDRPGKLGEASHELGLLLDLSWRP